MTITTAARQSYGFRDAKGNTSRVNFFVLYDGATFADGESAAGGVRAALVALTNAALISRRGLDGNFQNSNVFGATANYVDVEDKANLTLIATDGTFHHMQIPAPLSTIFTADGETVDQANSLVVALVTALSATTGSSGARIGSQSLSPFPAKCLVGGKRLRRKLHRRETIFTKSAKLDEPA